MTPASPGRRLLAWLRLGRPLFLAGGFLFHTLGVVIARSQGFPLDVPALLLGQLAVTAGQIHTHYANDYFDYAADRANATPTRWSGGSRVLVEGWVAPRLAWRTAVVALVVAIAATLLLPVLAGPGPLAVPLLALALLLAAGYSAPPLRLHSRRLGELTVALLVPGLTPVIGYYLQAGRLDPLPLLAVWPVVCLQFAMIVVINLPDASGDAATGKRTLVVALGGQGAVRLHTAVVLLAYLSLPFLVWAGLPPVAGLAAAGLMPIAAWQLGRLWWGAGERPSAWNSLGFWSVGLVVGTGALEWLAFATLIAP